MSAEMLPNKGTYTLIVSLKSGSRVKVGKLGCFDFPAGYYSYTGSALSGLQSRVERHLRRTKKMHWHIDFLLAVPVAEVTHVVASHTEQNRECDTNAWIKRARNVSVPVPRFGASDCRRNCKSHLLYFSEHNPQREIKQVYMRLFASFSEKLCHKALRNTNAG